MKSLLLALCLAVTLALAGCATTKILEPIGGSKADGTVTLAYAYGAFENPIVDWELANITAKQRCNAWGFANAQAFSGEHTTCIAADQYGCIRQQVSIIYQCSE